MSSYTWSQFPAHGTSNFELTARAALEGWRTNGAAMETRMNELESGTFFAGLSSPIIPSAAIISVGADKITDGTLPHAKLDTDGTVVDGAVAVYRTASSGFTYEDISGVVGGDTYQAKWDSSDSAGYLETKVASNANLLSGGSGASLVTPQGLKLGSITDSLAAIGEVSGAISIGPTQGVHTFTVTDTTTITLAGFTDSTVHYTVMLIITNTTNTITWADTIRWPDGDAPDFQSGRFRILMSTYDGGTTFDASQVITYAA